MKKMLYFIVVAYASWLGMMAVHESGHALAAWITGGHVQRMVLPLWGFSRTDVSPNPKPMVEVFAGPVWGSLLPLVVWAIARAIVRWPWNPWRFFCGFCLIANGSYLAVGWAVHAGDAWELVQLGVARWVLVAVGAAGCAGGLFIWHRLGSHHR
jgi:hypothetical protein